MLPGPRGRRAPRRTTRDRAGRRTACRPRRMRRSPARPSAAADVVLRQQDGRDPGEVVRLLVAQPQHLRRLEPGQRGVPRDLDDPVGPDPRRRSPRTASPVRWSFQSSAGRITSPAASRNTEPCICPVRPSPTTCDPHPRRSRDDRREHLAGRPPPRPPGPVPSTAAGARGAGTPTCGPPPPAPCVVDRDRSRPGGPDVDADRDAHRADDAFSALTFRTPATEERSMSSRAEHDRARALLPPLAEPAQRELGRAPRHVRDRLPHRRSSAGSTMLIHCTSSNATTETSRGTRSPACPSAIRTASARMLFAAKIAVGVGRARISSVASSIACSRWNEPDLDERRRGPGCRAL